MAGRIYFAGIYMTKGVPNLERGFDRPKLGTPFSFLRCFPFCGRVLRTAPLDKKSDRPKRDGFFYYGAYKPRRSLMIEMQKPTICLFLLKIVGAQ